MSNMPWFRSYSEVLSDRKILRVCRVTGTPKATIIGAWNILLALANDSPERGKLLLTDTIPYTSLDISLETGLPEADVKIILTAFFEVNMLRGKEIIEISNWEKRQYKSDNSSMRVAKYRKTRQDSGLPITPSFNSKTIIKRDNNKCIYCGSKENLCVDHISPTRIGGTDDTNNLAAACKMCSSGKAGRTPEQANYKIINKAAKTRYKKFLSSVTVAVTDDNGFRNVLESDTDTEEETDKEKNLRVFNSEIASFQKHFKLCFPTKPQPRKTTISKSFKIRIKDKYFYDNWLKALHRAGDSEFLKKKRWFTALWFLQNSKNWEKCLDGNYDDEKDSRQKNREIIEQGAQEYINAEPES